MDVLFSLACVVRWLPTGRMQSDRGSALPSCSFALAYGRAAEQVCFGGFATPAALPPPSSPHHAFNFSAVGSTHSTAARFRRPYPGSLGVPCSSSSRSEILQGGDLLPLLCFAKVDQVLDIWPLTLRSLLLIGQKGNAVHEPEHGLFWERTEANVMRCASASQSDT